MEKKPALPPNFTRLDVIKYDHNQLEKWRYQADVLATGASYMILSAFFDRSNVLVGGLLLENGDRFVELYSTRHWYNIFEVYAGNSTLIKGWYCNAASPAVFKPGSIHYIDLALDLVVLPDGSQQVLDSDEFESLDLDAELRTSALSGLGNLQDLFKTKPVLFRVEDWPRYHA
jgi:predicted RNA-binding protein associated with RNAse of E/G family